MSRLAMIGQDDTITTPLEALVPAWTPEDEENLRARVRQVPTASQWFDGTALVRRHPPSTAVTFAVDLVIDRAGRHRCPECRRRRELFAIAVTGHAFGASEPRCARCWGFR